MTEYVNYNNTYRGSATLKKTGVPIEWSAQRIEEYLKCSKDPIYFAEQYMKVVDPDEGAVTIKLFDYQKEMILSMLNNRFTVIATSRRAGKSTAVCAFILWFVTFHSEKTVAVLSNKGDTSQEILSKIQYAHHELPMWIKQGTDGWHKRSMSLENGSRVIAAATSKDAIRGFHIDLLFLDEAAHIENWQEFYTSVYPTISAAKHSRIVMVSTPKGLNHFHDFYQQAVEGKNGFHPIKVTWDRVPFFKNDPDWYNKTLASLNFDVQKFEQEYAVAWLGSSGTLIAGWKLEELRQQTQIPIVDKNGLKQYHTPEKNHSYVCICDVSEGKGLDYSAFHIIDVSYMPYKQVCSFKDNLITPYDYADVILQTCKLYNTAAVLIESNNLGNQIADHLNYDLEYVNVLHTINAGRNGKRISFGFSNRTEFGVRTTKTVKALGCSMLKLLLEQNQLLVVDKETIEELSRFSRKGKSYEAEPGCHDDLVMGLVLFAWLTDQEYFKQMNEVNTLDRLRDKNEEQIMNELIPFGFRDDHNPEEEQDFELLEIQMPESWMFPREHQ